MKHTTSRLTALAVVLALLGVAAPGARQLKSQPPADWMARMERPERIAALKIDQAFWCYCCGGMASGRTCPHEDRHRLHVSGTELRKALSEGGDVPAEFSRPEVLVVLREYYARLGIV
jgi:ATP sulfurylase